jgi:MFS family permease
MPDNSPQTTAATRRNVSLCLAGDAIWGLHAGLVAPATVLVLLLKEYGASPKMIGSLVSIETGSMLLPQVLGIYIFSSRKSRKRDLLAWHFAAIIPFLFVAALICFFADRLPATFVRWSVLGSFACFTFAIGVGLAAWTDWWASLFERNILGTVMGLAVGLGAVGGALGSVIAGGVINASQSTNAFALLYLAAGSIAIVSIFMYVFVSDPAAQREETAKRLNRSELLGRFKKSLADRNFRAFLVGRLLASFGFCFIPFVAIYYNSPEGGGLSKSTLVSFGAGMMAGSTIGNFILGRLGDKRGHRASLVTAASVQVATLLVLLLSSGKASCLAVYLGAGFCTAAGFVSHYNMLIETCPHDHRFAHITAGNLVVGLGMVLMPLAIGTFAEYFGLRILFAGSLALSVAALVWLIFRVKEPRQHLNFPE